MRVQEEEGLEEDFYYMTTCPDDNYRDSRTHFYGETPANNHVGYARELV